MIQILQHINACIVIVDVLSVIIQAIVYNANLAITWQILRALLVQFVPRGAKLASGL
jgi:hypothetical protein